MTRFLATRIIVAVVLSFGLVLSFVPAESSAGPLSVTNFAFNDGFGPNAGQWHGSVNVVGAAFGDTLTAVVDWAVFAPGDFQNYLDSQAIAQVDPTSPLDMTYVYQIHSVTFADPGIDIMTVGLEPIDGRGTLSAPSFVPTGAANEKSPTGGSDNNTSMVWSFAGNELLPGDSSSLLLFTSPYAPEYDFLAVASGLAAQPVSPLVPSPGNRLGPGIPEPGTLVLALTCGLLLLAKRRFS